MMLVRKLKKYFLLYLVLVMLMISFAVGLVVGKASGPNSSKSDNGSELGWQLFNEETQGRPEEVDFGLFWETWKKVNQSFIGDEKENIQERVYGAISGTVDSLGDPYTLFMTPQESEDFDAELEGKFEGIGAEVGMREGNITVVAPLDGSPAQRAGLLAGDYILGIDGEDTSDMTLMSAVSRIRGEKGTEVILTIFTPGDGAARDVAITRDTITVKSVKTEFKDNLAVVSISQFGDDTQEGFDNAVSKILLSDAEGVIIDLRNNPGGFLQAAVSMLGDYVPAGKTVLMEEIADGTRKELKSKGRARLAGMPTVVLVNGGSASASEIFTGAVQDYDIAYVIGTKTFGKGSVQDLQDLSDGSSLRVTIARWLTPNGRSIHLQGLDPDEVVEITREDISESRDPQMDRAIEYLKNQATSN